MRKAAMSFLLSLTFLIVNGQTKLIKDVFKKLPGNKIYDLTNATRDSMLSGKTFYPSDNDSNEIVAYNYGISTYVQNYMYVSMSFETGQRGSGMVEIRSFKMKNGDHLIVVSKTGGVWQVAYAQHSLSTFVYDKNKKLSEYKKKILPAIDEKMFIKQGVPDSIKKIISDNSNMTFDLSNEKLVLSLNSNYISQSKTLRRWLKGDLLRFDWINDHFVINKMEFQFAN